MCGDRGGLLASVLRPTMQLIMEETADTRSILGGDQGGILAFVPRPMAQWSWKKQADTKEHLVR